MKRFSLKAVVLSVVVLSLGVFSTLALGASNDIVIAVAGPMTGDYGQYGLFFRNAAELGAEMVNKSGGIGGRKIKIRVEDDRMDPSEATVVAQRLSHDKEVVAVIGHYSSSSTIAALPIYTQNKLVVISPSSTSPKLSGASPYFFRTAITDEPNGALSAEFVINQLGCKRIVVVHALSDGGFAFAGSFASRAEELGVPVLVTMAHEESARDFTAELTKIKSMEADIIVLPSNYTPAALMAKQAKEMGMKDILFFGNDGTATSDLIRVGGEAVEGFYGAIFFHADMETPEAKAFVAAYKDKYGDVPEGFGGNAFDAFNIIIEAIREVGPDRDAVRDYIEQIGRSKPGYKGVTGVNSFDANHDVQKGLVFVQVQNGEWVLASASK